ncbi:hypothetical protein ACIF8T_25455 [Streptomyces sp. NPDC085946]|uniref:hypothetical protein n=1 Tax=Streptomyces sp. NPDC085946 TaxID=3365744 RepID=UPI0037D740B7
MPEASDGAEVVAERLAVVCAHLAQIRRDVREGPGGDETPVDLLLATARDGGDVAGPLAVLHAVLQAGGDPQGLDGYTGTGAATRGVRPAGISDRPAETVYLCPAGRCARHWWPRATAAVPHCAISGAALRRERL